MGGVGSSRVSWASTERLVLSHLRKAGLDWRPGFIMVSGWWGRQTERQRLLRGSLLTKGRVTSGRAPGAGGGREAGSWGAERREKGRGHHSGFWGAWG